MKTIKKDLFIKAPERKYSCQVFLDNYTKTINFKTNNDPEGIENQS